MPPIHRPTLLLDQAKCQRNIRLLTDKARAHGLVPRPHFKAHQSAAVGAWFKQMGVDRIAVSSVEMAAYFVRAGWRDILIAAPINVLEIDQLNQLAQKAQIGVFVTMPDSAQYLAQYLTHPLRAWIEVDTGHFRAGIDAKDQVAIGQLLSIIDHSDKLLFGGFYAHSGQAHRRKNPHLIDLALAESRQALGQLRTRYEGEYPQLKICLGDTPTASMSDDFAGIDEISAGSWVFYDLVQYFIGSCQLEQVALALACPVVAKNKARKELVIYGGTAHLSSEFLEFSELPFYGYVVRLTAEGWEPVVDTYLCSLSHQHGTIKSSDSFFGQVQVGDVVGILPVLASQTAHQMGQYLTLEGDWLGTMQR
jgi:D-serine deaminase-like pyridoxal phosphate-dependent protein